MGKSKRKTDPRTLKRIRVVRFLALRKLLPQKRIAEVFGLDAKYVSEIRNGKKALYAGRAGDGKGARA